MNRAIAKNPRARADLVGCYVWIGERAGVENALRFLKAVDATLARLAQFPGIGAPHPTGHIRLAGLRCCRVSGFDRYLLFYRAPDERIELIRGLHGARDIRSILDAEARSDD